MRLRAPLVVVICALSCGSAVAKDFYITRIANDRESVSAVAPVSIVDLEGGIKRAELIDVGITTIEMEEGVFVSTGSLDVTVVEFDCQAGARKFRETSEHLQFSRGDEPIDKSTLNPYKEWTPVPANSGLQLDSDFVCGWPKLDPEAEAIKVPADDDWAFVDSVVDTMDRMRTAK